MEALKQQLLRIQQMLSALTPSQKMLSFSLVIIMIMTMFYWSKYAGTAEKVVLLDQPMSPEEISTIKTQLSVKNISYVVQGDRILVPTDKKFEIIADLGYMQLLPHNMSTGFEDIVVKYASPFDNSMRSEALLNQAKMRTLGGIIAAWPGVKSAAVNIDAQRKYSPGHNIMPVGSVSITMKSGNEPSRKLAAAAADLLIGSQAGLQKENIKVLINNTTVHLDDGSQSGGMGGGDNTILERKSEYEKYYMEKILNTVHINEAYATVYVDLNTKASVINERTVDSKNIVKIPKKQTSASSENDQSTPAGAPGAPANTGNSIEGGSDGGGAGQKSTTEKTDVENDTDHGVKNVVTQDPAGSATVTSAAINLPEDYFVNMWKRRNPGGKEPTADDIDKLVKAQTPQIRDLVKRATNIKEDEFITVASYFDVSQPFNPSEATSNATLASMPASMGFGAKEIAIGVLALVSLFMVSMMVKKSAPGNQVLLNADGSVNLAGKGGAAGEHSPEVAQALAQITANADLVGEVGEGGMMLTGHEMSEADMESKQVIEQVGTMVQSDPDGAANLVKRWINRE